MVHDFMIGCDPELGFVSEATGQRLNACSYISDPDHCATFGLDGCNIVSELRPKPSTDPMQVVNRIRSAMLTALRRTPSLDCVQWKAGGMVGANPIGGHIHFGTSECLASDKYRDALAVLDRYLSIPLALIEDAREFKDRREHYGRLSDHRPQPHGIEYRTPFELADIPIRGQRRAFVG